MSKSIKVKGFFKDVKGINRIVGLREGNRIKASAVPDPKDFVTDMAHFLHPGYRDVKVIKIRSTSPTSLTFRFRPVEGEIPLFQSGQYVSFRLKIGESILTRPYSISSAPCDARGKDGFFEVTIRRNVSYLVPDYFFNNVKEGDILSADLPFGSFYWEPLRDTKNIVALAGGAGITPFCSMAGEIARGKMKGCKLTILYGSAKESDIVLKDDLEALEKECPDIKVVNVISDDPGWKGEKGFIGADIIKKYAGEDPTFMFCGPYKMFTFVEKALKELGVPARRFRHDVVNNPSDAKMIPGYPAENQSKVFKIKVMRGLHEDVIEAKGSESVAVALERSAILIDTHCRNGECGMCRSQLLSGDIFVSPIGDGRRMMDKEMGWFHACSSWPLSDLTIRIPIM